MNAKRAAAIAMTCLLGVGGCNSREPVPPPNVKVNANPLKGYKVRLTIPEPPGALHVTAEVTYAISNKRDCVPLDYGMALGGTHPTFREIRVAEIASLSDTEYEMIFFDDAFGSEDYYGLGRCDWRGWPTFTIAWGGGSVEASVLAGREKLGETAIRLCPVDPTGPSPMCGGKEYVRQDIEEYFAIEILTTRNR